MLKIYIKVMESGIGFSIIIALVLGYLSQENYKNKYKAILISLSLGVISAIISSIVREIPNFTNRSSLSFWSMVPIVISLLGIVIFYILKRKNVKHTEDLFVISIVIYIISSFFYYMPTILVQLNNFVYYGESAISTMVLYRIIGYIFGIVMMLLSGSVVFKTIRKIEGGFKDKVLIISLLIWGINQIFIILQKLYAVGVIPKSTTIFMTIAWVINHANYISFSIMILIAVLPAFLYMKNRTVTKEYNNPAQLRKIQYNMKRNRNLAKFFVLVVFVNIFSLTILKAYAGRDIELSAPEEYVIEDGYITVPLSELEDMKLHRYQYTADNGIHMRFFLIKKSQGSYGVVLDACEICGPSGYYERGDDVICKLCDVVMNRGTIGFKGGCNPIPIPYIVHDEKIKISPQDLDANSFVFK